MVTTACTAHITLWTAIFDRQATVCTVTMPDGSVHTFYGRDSNDANAQAEDFLNGCPQPLSGKLTLLGNRIPMEVWLQGPNGSGGTELSGAFVDTGAATTTLPDSVLQELGYTPVGYTTISGVVNGASSGANIYRVPGDAFEVYETGQGEWVPLSTGTITVDGVIDSSMELLGPELFRNGASLSLNDRIWVITPVCP
jgi:hypothetical protein